MNQNSFSYSGHIKFPLPGVSTGSWSTVDWENWVKGTCELSEPTEIRTTHLGTWRATGKRDEKGEMLYSKV